MMEINPKQAHTFFSHDLINLDAFFFSNNYYYLMYIQVFSICDLKYQNQVQSSFVGLCNEIQSYTESTIIDLILSPVFEFYNLEGLFFENLDPVITYFKFDTLFKIYFWLTGKRGTLKRKTIKLFHDAFKNAVEGEVYRRILNVLPSIVSETINDVGEPPAQYNDRDSDEFYYYYYDFVEKVVNEAVKVEVEELVNEIPIPFSSKVIDFDNILSEVYIADEIFAFFGGPNDDYAQTDYIEERLTEKEEWNFIDGMFEIK